MPNLNPDNVGKFQDLISKNPAAFVGAVFVIMFGFTYGINLNNSSKEEKRCWELVKIEREAKDKAIAEQNELKDKLLVKSGVLDKVEKRIDEANAELIKEKIEKLEQ